MKSSDTDNVIFLFFIITLPLIILSLVGYKVYNNEITEEKLEKERVILEAKLEEERSIVEANLAKIREYEDALIIKKDAYLSCAEDHSKYSYRANQDLFKTETFSLKFFESLLVDEKDCTSYLEIDNAIQCIHTPNGWQSISKMKSPQCQSIFYRKKQSEFIENK